MGTREIVTLQFGHYSNFVGAHFWNIQELSFDYSGITKNECNHDILYREGRTIDGQATYTPRLLLADLQGSLGSLPTTGGLLNETSSEETQIWENIEKVEEPTCSKNQYLADIDTNIDVTSKEYNLENEIKTWTDFLYPRFHSRTLNIIKEYKHENKLVIKPLTN